MPISEDVKQNLYGMGLTKLTEIQVRAFDPILRGRSFLGRSQTGTGKTIAYLLPVLERLRHAKITEPHSVLILVPTRELAKQVGGAVLSLAVGLDVALVYGGPPLYEQEELVRLGPRVVVSTPGRCTSLLDRGALLTKNIRVLVIDEVDAMLGYEFRGRTERVLAAVGKPSLQHVLFSASMSPDVMALIRRHFGQLDVVDLVNRGGLRGAAAVQEVEHILCKVPPASGGRVLDSSRIRILMHLLDSRIGLLPGARCIIFTEGTSEAKVLLSHPALNGRARAVHSESSEKDRDFVLTAFASREFDVLLATDLVSRGVDFEDIALVLQVRPPRDASKYVHRAGRTGRAGQGGTVITLYEPSEHPHVQRIREVTRQKFKMEATPGPGDLHHAAVSRILDDLLSVQEEEYAPFLGDASQLLEQHGPQVLATSMAILDARHADLKRAGEEAPSLLSGRRGFVCLLVHDPQHDYVEGAADVRKVMASLLPPRALQLFKGAAPAAEAVIGKITRTADGWAIDVDQRFALGVVEDIRSGRKSSPFEVSVAQQLPRLSRMPVTSRAARRTPWDTQRRSALMGASRRSSKERKGGPRMDGTMPGFASGRKR